MTRGRLIAALVVGAALMLSRANNLIALLLPALIPLVLIIASIGRVSTHRAVRTGVFATCQLAVWFPLVYWTIRAQARRGWSWGSTTGNDVPVPTIWLLMVIFSAGWMFTILRFSRKVQLT